MKPAKFSFTHLFVLYSINIALASCACGYGCPTSSSDTPHKAKGKPLDTTVGDLAQLPESTYTYQSPSHLPMVNGDEMDWSEKAKY